MTPDMVPAFLFGDFKEIGHRDESISVGHQSEFVRSTSQDILNETRQLLGFFDAHYCSHAVRWCQPTNLTACLTRMPRFDKFLKLCEIFNLKRSEARLPHPTRLGAPQRCYKTFFEWRFLARLSRPSWRWFTATHGSSEPAVYLFLHVQTFTSNHATTEPDA